VSGPAARGKRRGSSRARGRVVIDAGRPRTNGRRPRSGVFEPAPLARERAARDDRGSGAALLTSVKPPQPEPRMMSRSFLDVRGFEIFISRWTCWTGSWAAGLGAALGLGAGPPTSDVGAA
jgi:hypothetical protein